MRKEYGKILRSYFTQRMKEVAPDFNESKESSVYLWPGERAFFRSESDSIKSWVVLSPSPKGEDKFNVMIGWSTLGRYPELNVIPSIIKPTEDRKEFEQKEYLTRLPQLWTNEDACWVVKEFELALTVEDFEKAMEPISTDEATKSVQPLVDNAIQKILDVGIPYLSELVEYKLKK